MKNEKCIDKIDFLSRLPDFLGFSSVDVCFIRIAQRLVCIAPEPVVFCLGPVKPNRDIQLLHGVGNAALLPQG